MLAKFKSSLVSMLKQDKLPKHIFNIFGPVNLDKIEMVPIGSNITKKTVNNVHCGD
jgi:hypothetical protein